MLFRARNQADLLVASYNIHKCVGVDQRFDPERVAAVIAEIDADIVALQEVGRRKPLLDLARLERETGFRPAPGVGGPEAQGWHGNLLLVREGAVREVRRIRLPGVEPRGALVVDIEFAAGPLRVVAAHLSLLRRARAQQAATILAAAAAADRRPAILLGDLNEWRLGRWSSLQSLGHAFGPLSAALPSFPSRFPLLALDRILGSPHELISGVEVHDTALARVASDHLPVKAHIDLEAVTVGREGRLAA